MLLNRLSSQTTLSTLLWLSARCAFACDVPDSVDPANVVPVIWSRATAAAQFPAGPKVIPTQDINEELTIAFVENTKTRLSYFLVRPEDAPCWQERPALGRSLTNLAKEIKAMRTSELPDGVVMVTAGGNFESSLILAQRILKKASELDRDTLAVGIPARDLIFIADPRKPAAMARLKATVAEAFKDSPGAISDKVFLVSGCQISVLKEGNSTTEQSACAR
jgi:hypothetical protein